MLLILGLGVVGWISGRTRARALAMVSEARPHSLPTQHGWYVALWTIAPALLFLVIWGQVSGGLINAAVMAEPAAQSLSGDAMSRDAILGEARSLADGSLEAAFNPAAEALVKPYAAAIRYYGTIGAVVALLLAFAGAAYSWTRVRPDFRARTQVERVVMAILLGASMIAIFTTFGIVASLVFESGRFFSMVPPSEFFASLKWSPQVTLVDGQENGFGAVPLFWGTIFIGAIIAMIVAIPLGLMSAIYLTQYAAASTRRWMKPALEMLAGVPTVVYGYFAALTVAPMVRDFAIFLGMENPSSESAMAAGLVMGIMIIPFVSSMADDSIAAVPQAMRDGSLAMGATTSETIRRVLIPAALPGIVGGVLLAVSRAIGETMIVVMAAGLAANMTANPFASVTTVTTQIVQLLTGDQEFDTAKTLAAFALGLVLFIVTLLLNIVALRVVKKYREAYE
jgi:phosphate transport system permease protein